MIRALQGTPKHLSRTANLEGFTYLMLNLDFICNHKCRKCFNLEDDQPVRSGNHITLERQTDLIKEAADLGGKVVVFSGEGEPLLSKVIRKLVEQTCMSGMIPIVYSNGTTLTDDNLKLLVDNNASLVISLDSLNAERYMWLTRPKLDITFKKVMSNIDRAVDVFDKLRYRTGELDALRVAVVTTVSRVNEDEIEQIKKYFGERAYFICNPLAELGNATSHWAEFRIDEKAKVRHQRLIGRLSETGGPLTLQKNGCCGYLQGLGISPDGYYMTCAYTRKTNGLLVNVRNVTLREAFEHKQRIEVAHYKKYGIAPCLVRAASFQHYIDTLTAQQAFFSCYGILENN